MAKMKMIRLGTTLALCGQPPTHMLRTTITLLIAALLAGLVGLSGGSGGTAAFIAQVSFYYLLFLLLASVFVALIRDGFRKPTL